MAQVVTTPVLYISDGTRLVSVEAAEQVLPNVRGDFYVESWSDRDDEDTAKVFGPFSYAMDAADAARHALSQDPNVNVTLEVLARRTADTIAPNDFSGILAPVSLR